ncbi:MAG: Ig-like domain repeat protein, partial [Ruminiclostridium sp.]|nr:Ig-like domain repeat protein [Ruminiclostridium sp.]
DVNDENNNPVDDRARVTFTPALNSLSAGENQTLTAYYPGNAAYKPSTATTTLSLIPMDAQVTVTVKDNVVPYGTPYQITAQTQPAGLEKLVFAAGLDLSMMDPAQGSLDGLITTLHLMSPQGLREPLFNYLTTQDNDNHLTLGDLRRAAHTLSANPALAQQLGLSAASLRAVEEMLPLFGSLADSLPLALTEDQPEDIGLYLVGAVIAQRNYQPDVDLALLAITPIHCRIDLDWKNEVSALSLHDLQTPNLLDAQVVRVEEGGSIADAASKLMHLFIGVDPHGQILFANRQQDLVQGTYLEVAVTKDWGNVRYSCAPILRQISVGQQKVNLVFKDHRNQPVIELLHVMGRAPGARLEITYPDGTPVPQAKQDQFLSFSYISLLDRSAVAAITGPGLYLAIASYAETDEAGNITCAGAAPLLVVVTPQVKAFAIQDVTVPYDGQPHFIDIQDANDPKLPYGALIVDKERKHLNLILPDEMDSYEEALALLGQFQPMIQYLEENAQEGMMPLFLKNLLIQVQKDLYDTSDYLVEIGAPLPSQPGVYQVYVGAMGWLYPS